MPFLQERIQKESSGIPYKDIDLWLGMLTRVFSDGHAYTSSLGKYKKVNGRWDFYESDNSFPLRLEGPAYAEINLALNQAWQSLQ